jgi:hypothetical protein
VRDAVGVRFDDCRVSVSGFEHRRAIVTRDAQVDGACRVTP